MNKLETYGKKEEEIKWDKIILQVIITFITLIILRILGWIIWQT